MSNTMSTAQSNVPDNREDFLEKAVPAMAEELQALAEEGEGKDLCTICRERPTLADWPIHMPECSHVFCTDCIGTWAKSSNKCPNCRAILYEAPPPPPQANTEEDAAAADALAAAFVALADDDSMLPWDAFANGEWVDGFFIPSNPGPIGWTDDTPATQAEGDWDQEGG